LDKEPVIQRVAVEVFHKATDWKGIVGEILDTAGFFELLEAADDYANRPRYAEFRVQREALQKAIAKAKGGMP